MVEIFLPRLKDGSNHIKVWINGELHIVPRGVKCTVPDEVAEIIKNSQKSEENVALLQQIYTGIPEVKEAGEKLKKVQKKQKL